MAKEKGPWLIHFDGVKVAKDFMTGIISSDELIDNFSEAWIPAYQRDRVMNKKKIESLKEVFLTGGKIDSIKLNLVGEYLKDGRQAILSGHLRTIDGQQRLWALKESGARGFNMPVELYLNIPHDEEVDLFHQFNRDSSRLTVGDLVKSTRGTFGQMVSGRVLKDKSYPIRVNVNSRTNGISLSQYGSLLYLVHRHIYLKTDMVKMPTGKRIIGFMEDEYPAHEAQITEYGARTVLSAMVKIFGSYDSKALAYTRIFMSAFSNVVVSNFMTDTGQIAFGPFKLKALELRKLLSNARTRELLTSNTEGLLYNEIVRFFNYKMKNHKLPFLEERTVGDSEELRKFRTARSTAVQNKQREASRGRSPSAGVAMAAKGR